MKKYRHTLVIILTAILLVLTLGACSQKDAAQGGQTAEPAAKTQIEAETSEAQEAAEETQASEMQPAEEAAEAAESIGTIETEAAAQEETNAASVSVPVSGIRPLYTLEAHYYYETDQVEDNYLTLAGGSCEAARLTEEAKAAYPSLGSALDALAEKMINEAEEEYVGVLHAAKGFKDDYYDGSTDFPSGEVTFGIEPVRCDSSVLSFYQSVSSYYPGAAHGLLGYVGYNYDTVTGAQIALTDVVTDPAAMVPAVAENLVAIGDGAPVTDIESELEDYFDQNIESLVWTLDRDGIVVRFAPYEIAPYAMGTLEARIPFARYPELFTGKYGPSEGSFAKMTDPNTQVFVDLYGDGQEEAVRVTGSYDEASDYYYCNEIRVTAGEKECCVAEDFYSWKPVLLRTEDGRIIILVETASDNDYTNLHVFEIRDGEPVYAGNMAGTGFASVYHARPEDADDLDEWNLGWYTEIFPILDPSSFALETRTDLMSTYGAMRCYEIGADGMPSPLTDYYEVTGDITLTSKVPLEAEFVDLNTGELTGESAELPAGTACRMWRTNCEDTVDLLLEDGRAFRVRCTREWPQMVNDIPLEDAFDGTMFAG